MRGFRFAGQFSDLCGGDASQPIVGLGPSNRPQYRTSSSALGLISVESSQRQVGFDARQKVAIPRLATPADRQERREKPRL